MRAQTIAERLGLFPADAPRIGDLIGLQLSAKHPRGDEMQRQVAAMNKSRR